MSQQVLAARAAERRNDAAVFIWFKGHLVDWRDFPILSHVRVYDMAGLEGDLRSLVSVQP